MLYPLYLFYSFDSEKKPGHLSYNTSGEKDVSTNKEEVTIKAKQKSVSQGVNALEFYLYHY